MNKKYNLSVIMKRAWSIFKKIPMTFNEALRIAWKEAKIKVQDNIQKVKTLKDVIIERMELMCKDGNDAGVFHFETYINDWLKYGRNRTYLKIIKTRKHSSMHQEYDYGYYDNISEIYVPGKHNIREGYGFYGDSDYVAF